MTPMRRRVTFKFTLSSPILKNFLAATHDVPTRIGAMWTVFLISVLGAPFPFDGPG